MSDSPAIDAGKSQEDAVAKSMPTATAESSTGSKAQSDKSVSVQPLVRNKASIPSTRSNNRSKAGEVPSGSNASGTSADSIERPSKRQRTAALKNTKGKGGSKAPSTTPEMTKPPSFADIVQRHLKRDAKGVPVTERVEVDSLRHSTLGRSLNEAEVDVLSRRIQQKGYLSTLNSILTFVNRDLQKVLLDGNHRVAALKRLHANRTDDADETYKFVDVMIVEGLDQDKLSIIATTLNSEGEHHVLVKLYDKLSMFGRFRTPGMSRKELSEKLTKSYTELGLGSALSTLRATLAVADRVGTVLMHVIKELSKMIAEELALARLSDKALNIEVLKRIQSAVPGDIAQAVAMYRVASLAFVLGRAPKKEEEAIAYQEDLIAPIVTCMERTIALLPFETWPDMLQKSMRTHVMLLTTDSPKYKALCAHIQECDAEAKDTANLYGSGEDSQKLQELCLQKPFRVVADAMTEEKFPEIAGLLSAREQGVTELEARLGAEFGSKKDQPSGPSTRSQEDGNDEDDDSESATGAHNEEGGPNYDDPDEVDNASVHASDEEENGEEESPDMGGTEGGGTPKKASRQLQAGSPGASKHTAQPFRLPHNLDEATRKAWPMALSCIEDPGVLRKVCRSLGSPAVRSHGVPLAFINLGGLIGQAQGKGEDFTTSMDCLWDNFTDAMCEPPLAEDGTVVYFLYDVGQVYLLRRLLETKVHKFQIIYTHILAGKVGAPATDPKSDFKDSNVVFLVIVHPHTSYFVDRNQVLHGQGTEEGQANCGSSMVHLLRLNDLQGLLKTLCLRYISNRGQVLGLRSPETYLSSRKTCKATALESAINQAMIVGPLLAGCPVAALEFNCSADSLSDRADAWQNTGFSTFRTAWGQLGLLADITSSNGGRSSPKETSEGTSVGTAGSDLAGSSMNAAADKHNELATKISGTRTPGEANPKIDTGDSVKADGVSPQPAGADGAPRYQCDIVGCQNSDKKGMHKCSRCDNKVHNLCCSSILLLDDLVFMCSSCFKKPEEGIPPSSPSSASETEN